MPSVVAVGHVGINAKDLAALARFYSEVVGLRPTVYHEGVIAIFAIGRTQTDLFLMPGEPGPIEFDLIADDVDGFRARLAAAGVPCTETKSDERSGHKGFRFTDPEGNELRITSGHERR